MGLDYTQDGGRDGGLLIKSKDEDQREKSVQHGVEKA